MATSSKVWCSLTNLQTFYLDLSDGLLSGHLKGVSVLATQEELHLDAGRNQERAESHYRLYYGGNQLVA